MFFMNDVQPHTMREPGETRLSRTETNSIAPLKLRQANFTPVRTHSGTKMAY